MRYLIPLLLLALPGLAQQSGLRVNASQETAWLEFQNLALHTDLDAIPKKDPHKDDLKELYESNTEFLNELVKEHLVITDTIFTNYLQQIADDIFRANPELPRNEIRLGIYRNPVPNAASYGQGTILFHTGLLTRLQNEAQLVYILCHEISHYYLKHRQRSLNSYFSRIDSKEFKARLAAIRKSEYRQGQQLSELIFDQAFSMGRHSRAFEEEADSMALVLMRRTSYNIQMAPATLLMLDSLDQPKYAASLDVRSALNTKTYPFKASWLQTGSTLSFTASEEELNKRRQLADSLKTHPDCPIRASRIRLALEQDQKGGALLNAHSLSQLQTLQQKIDLDLPQLYLDQELLGHALYQSLLLQRTFPGNKDLRLISCKALVEMAKSQKAHNLGRKLELPDASEYDADYNQLLTAFSNMRLGEMIDLAKAFCDEAKPELSGHADFSRLQNELASLNNQ